MLLYCAMRRTLYTAPPFQVDNNRLPSQKWFPLHQYSMLTLPGVWFSNIKHNHHAYLHLIVEFDIFRFLKLRFWPMILCECQIFWRWAQSYTVLLHASEACMFINSMMKRQPIFLTMDKNKTLFQEFLKKIQKINSFVIVFWKSPSHLSRNH